ncbi:MAG: class B sortase [Ruminococcaceae bacterium]|nr:class B sortase [Oscillospiraceae bacterium]
MSNEAPKKKGNVLRVMIIVACTAALVACGLYFVDYMRQSVQMQQQNEDLREIFKTNEDEKTPTPTPVQSEDVPTGEQTPPPTPTPSKGDSIVVGGDHNDAQTGSVLTQFDALLEINPDTVGWISIENTETKKEDIDLAVMQRENDNEYYLTHDFYGETKKHGMIFMDYRNGISPLSQNIILYGHNMLDGTMFSQVANYRNLDFARKHPVISFMTLYGEYQWLVFAAYKTDTSAENHYLYVDFESQEAFMQYVAAAEGRSDIDFGVDVQKDDMILTLSTCTSVNENERIVVHARMVREGEQIKSTKMTKNTDKQIVPYVITEEAPTEE